MLSRSQWPMGLVLGLSLVAVPAARATNPCISDAKETFTDAYAQCKEDYQVAKDNCINKDHDCVEACRAGREQCVIASGLPDALDVCRTVLYAAKADCRTNNPPDSTALDSCIDQKQVAAFQCRQAARKAAKPAVVACRTGFRACVQACPAPAMGDPVVDKVACKLQARTDYLQCKKDSREAFQVQKDLCLNRDHDCVEGCRADRDTCREPIENQLESDIATCNHARDITVAGCNGDQSCIDDANVAAFICRDAARETARPGLQTCGQNFQSCAELCTCVGSCPP